VAVTLGNGDMVRLLLDRGADPNRRDDWPETILQVAITNSHIHLIQLLLDHGANARAGGVYADSALVAAARSGNLEAANILLKHGADVNYDRVCQTPLYAAAYSGHERMVQLLLDWGAKVNTLTGPHGCALRAALGKNRTSIADLLISKGADPNVGEDVDWDSDDGDYPHYDVIRGRVSKEWFEQGYKLLQEKKGYGGGNR
jgi:ankyrin repeat protein